MSYLVTDNVTFEENYIFVKISNNFQDTVKLRKSFI